MEHAQEREFDFRMNMTLPKDVSSIIQDLDDMVNGKGDHADHTRKQIGRCILCSCGVRVQGRLK